MAHLVALVASLLVFTLVFTQDSPFVVNLSNHCFRCLCYTATQCNLTLGCVAGYCGPYKISRIYWTDAGQVIKPGDEVERAGAYEDCAIDYNCAKKIIVNYFVKYGRDCNGDGVTDCDDFTMINFNGGGLCHQDLKRNEFGRAWLDRYRICNPGTRL